MASISLRCLKVISPFWTTTSLRSCDLSSTHNRSGVHSIRAIHGCHLANRIRLEPNNFEVVSPLVAPPWCHLGVPAGCCIVSCRPLIAPPSCRLVAPAGCCIASRCPLIALPCRHLVTPAGCRIASCRPLIVPPFRQLVDPDCCHIASPRPLVAPRVAVSSSHRAGWLLCRLSMRRTLVDSSSRHAASRCLVAPAGCHAIISRRPLAAPPSRPLIMLAGCCVACPCAALSSSRCSPTPTPSNAVKCCCHHQNAVSIVHRCRCHSCRPSPMSNANAHLRPSPLSNADARHCHPPPLMSISIVALSSPICSPHHRRRRTLPPPLNAVFIVHRRRRRRHCRTHLHPLPKKEAPAPAPPPPAYQRQHHCEHVYKSRQLGHI